MLPKSYRGEGATLTSLAGGLAAVIALLINGHAVQNNVAGGWRLGWYVAFAMNLIVVALLYFFYDPRLPPNPEGRTTWEVLKHDIDWIGTGLLIAFAVPFMMGLTWGGGRYPWVSTHVLGTMLVGTVSLVGLVIRTLCCNYARPLTRHSQTRCSSTSTASLIMIYSSRGTFLSEPSVSSPRGLCVSWSCLFC